VVFACNNESAVGALNTSSLGNATIVIPTPVLCCEQQGGTVPEDPLVPVSIIVSDSSAQESTTSCDDLYPILLDVFSVVRAPPHDPCKHASMHAGEQRAPHPLWLPRPLGCCAGASQQSAAGPHRLQLQR
jgi:hypothetical protein